MKFKYTVTVNGKEAWPGNDNKVAANVVIPSLIAKYPDAEVKKVLNKTEKATRVATAELVLADGSVVPMTKENIKKAQAR